MHVHVSFTFTFYLFAFMLFSYWFFKEHSKRKFDDALDVLSKYPHVDCAGGYKLHYVVGETYMFIIQTQEPFVNGRIPDKYLRKCDTIQWLGNHTTLDNDTWSILNQEDDKILENACFHFRYIHGDFSETENNIHSTTFTEMKMKRGVWRKFPLLSYLLEVVNRPGIEEQELNDNGVALWDTHTLLNGIFPGTYWCGFGNIANDVYTNLGKYTDVDLCCRTHDLCKPKVRPFKTRYYHHNPGIIPLSHCSCDLEFYNCLKVSNSSASNRIGQIFFNLARVQCFDFDVRDVCTFNVIGWCLDSQQRCAAHPKFSPFY